jgi:hypothetical protein
MSDAPRYGVHPRAAFREVDGELFIVTPDNHFHNLADPVATAIWAACDEAPRTEDELLATVTRRFEVDPEVARADLRAFLADALAKDLMVTL